jgi:hypothetical protein
MNHREAKLSLSQVLGKALALSVLLQAQVTEVVANLFKDKKI